MKIALFLGAGASVPYGMPTTAGLWDRMRSAGTALPLESMRHSAEFPDAEHILYVVGQMIDFAETRAGRLYARHDTGGTFSDSVDKSRSLKTVLEEIIPASYKWSPSHNQAAAEVLGPLFEMARSDDQLVTVFTTNFDTAIEEYCARDERIERIDGFSDRAPGGGRVWNGEFVARDEGAHTRVFLYKLHGSMSWLRRDLDGIMSIVQKPDTRASDNPDHDMFIRPTLDVKDEATAADPYATIWKEFVDRLPSFDACVAIGYSFRDRRISEKLVDFVRAGKTLVAISPTAAEDFREHALGNEPTPTQRHEWANKPLCHMKHVSGIGTGHFYAMNERLENTDMHIVNLVLLRRRTPYYMGLIPAATA